MPPIAKMNVVPHANTNQRTVTLNTAKIVKSNVQIVIRDVIQKRNAKMIIAENIALSTVAHAVLIKV